jgi:prepilin-type N-terminal cleavage/methylation domain-containing protein
MKKVTQSPDKNIVQRKGVTLVEMSVVISVLVILVSATTFSVGAYRNWQAGLAAGEQLRAIHQAQKLYLADNPTEGPATFATNGATKISPYLPTGANNAGTLPVVLDADGVAMAVDITVVPPTVADPSGNTSDGLWDVNE